MADVLATKVDLRERHFATQAEVDHLRKEIDVLREQLRDQRNEARDRKLIFRFVVALTALFTIFGSTAIAVQRLLPL